MDRTAQLKRGQVKLLEQVMQLSEEIKELNKELQQLFETEVDDASKEEEKKEK